MDHYIIVDLGASNGRVIVANYENETFAFDVVHRFPNVPVISNEGELFWDILRIFTDIKDGIRIAARKYDNKIKSLAIDTFGCDFGFLDDKGRLMGNPLHYRFEKQWELSGEMHEILTEEEFFRLSQGPTNRIMGIYKLYALMRQDAFEYRYGAHLLMIPDLLNYFLTGKISNEFTNATMTQLTSQIKRDWEPEITEKLGLRNEFLGPISEPGTYLGPIKPSVCEELEIEPIDVIIPATHDTASAVAGIPVKYPEKNWGFISLGTWALSGLERNEPCLDPAIVPLEFGNEGGTYGKSMLLKNLNGMWIIQQCRNYWNKENTAGKELSWDDIVVLAREAKPQKAVIDIQLPVFNGMPANMPLEIQNYCRQTGQEVPETVGEIAECVYKSLALEVRASFDAVMKVLGEKLEVLQIAGGGTQNHLLCQWISNAAGLPAVCGPTETTAVGNLLFQLKVAGEVATLEEGRMIAAKAEDVYEVTPEAEEAGYWEEQYKHFISVVHA